MDIGTLKIILIFAMLLGGLYLVRRYRHIPALTLILLCFIIFHTPVNHLRDFIFFVGVGLVLAGINIEYIKRIGCCSNDDKFNLMFF